MGWGWWVMMVEEKTPRVSNSHPAPGLWEHKWLLVIQRDEGAWTAGSGTRLLGTSFHLVLMPLSPSATSFWGLPPSPVGHYYPILQVRRLRFLKENTCLR